jgi:UDP-N-acetylmuramyl pentapeptide phosphotransferase/UDP-N-acetylglucosamine-1-phosphate transferase
MTLAIILAFSAFLISLLGTRLTILALRQRSVLIDRPNLRSNHKSPTPRAGGIAVVMSLIICLLVVDINYAVILALFLLAAVSLLDDLIGLPQWVRLLVQVLAVTIALGLMHTSLFGGLLPPWLDKLVIGVLWIWFINLFNFMDGIDGIAGTEMVGIGAGLLMINVMLGIFPNLLSYYGIILAFAGCGFLWWNWHPAKIFLGDVGSVPIGFLTAYFLLLTAEAGYGYSAAILPAYYLADSTITIARRHWHGKKIWQAHSEHYYQRAVRGGRKHSSVSRYIFGINLLLILLSTLSALNRSLGIFYLGTAYMAVFMLLGFFAHTRPDTHGEDVL